MGGILTIISMIFHREIKPRTGTKASLNPIVNKQSQPAPANALLRVVSKGGIKDKPVVSTIIQLRTVREQLSRLDFNLEEEDMHSKAATVQKAVTHTTQQAPILEQPFTEQVDQLSKCKLLPFPTINTDQKGIILQSIQTTIPTINLVKTWASKECGSKPTWAIIHIQIQ